MFSHRCTLGEAVADYLAALTVAGRSSQTLHTYRCILGRMVKGLGDGPIDKINDSELHDYLMRFADFSLAYRSLVGRVIKRFFQWCVEERVLKVNPIANLRLPQPQANPVRPFRQEEVDALLSRANRMERALILLLLDTGLRGGELAALQKGDIDMDENLIYVRHGKGGKQRIVALNDSPKKALQSYLAQAQSVDGAVWPEDFDRPALGRMLDRLAKRSHICCCHPHRFRHTWAASFLAETGDAAALRKLAGWSSWATVQRYTDFNEGQRAIEVHKRHPLVEEVGRCPRHIPAQGEGVLHSPR